MMRRMLNCAARRFLLVVAFLVVAGCGWRTDAEDTPKSRSVSDVLTGFHAESWRDRQTAFYELLDLGAGGKYAGRTDLVPSILSSLNRSNPEKTDEIRLALIGLLSTENSFVQSERSEYARTGATLSEEYINYYGDVIAAVTSLNDKRSIAALLDAITTGGMVTRALAQFGSEALPALVEKLKDRDPLVRSAATIAISGMLDSEDGRKSPSIRTQIREVLVRSARDEDPNVRITAVTHLVRLGDHGVRAIVERIARDDSYEVISEQGRAVFPVREAAKRALQLRP